MSGQPFRATTLRGSAGANCAAKPRVVPSSSPAAAPSRAAARRQPAIGDLRVSDVVAGLPCLPLRASIRGDAAGATAFVEKGSQRRIDAAYAAPCASWRQRRASAPTDRQLGRARVVPMHRGHRVERRGASAGRSSQAGVSDDRAEPLARRRRRALWRSRGLAPAPVACVSIRRPPAERTNGGAPLGASRRPIEG
jgi:hypothetical protein